jgi:ABC-type amino acid transport substrate-binding protein
MKKLILICLGLILFLPGSSLGRIVKIKYFQTGLRYEYRVQLLKLALDKASGPEDTYQLQAYPTSVTQARGLALLAANEIDVVFLATNKAREEKYLPIRIPILRGILGYRVFLIHKDSKERFARIKSFEQLRDRYRAGFGSHWADYQILETNGIHLIGVASDENLFKMLIKKRFDYFPRGINEAWDEVQSKGKEYPALMVEENLAFYYPFPVYFFVNKANHKLANIIEHGLEIALKDGSFKELFLKHHAAVLDRVKFEKRLLFTLKNPTLPDNFQGVDTSWWFKGN